MPRSLVALGSNLGDREKTLALAVELLRTNPSVLQVRCSRWHETAPVGGATGQGSFLNAAASLDTTLAPLALHAALRQIENGLGRQRGERWAPRAIDLDLLLYDGLILDTEALVVPHPRMAFRRFVLEPAAEVAPDMVHPAIGWTIARLLEHLNGAARYLALTGLPGSGKTALAALLVRAVGGRFLADPLGGLGEAHPPGSPSRVYQRQIQFLRRRADVLDRRHGPADDVLTISDFYWDQCLAYAQIELAASGFELFCQAAEQARPQLISPKLLVVLDAPTNAASTGSPTHESQRSAALRRELLRVAGVADRGPVLYVNSADRRAQFDEIAAAIEAMK